ncbi:MBL fold metallo-hydrolase [Gottfriedia acidiceleris]|uniref:MBL fold metallo-hydrolase n=1 Tax=Gottfriedia acidiceleris TaxID=371036 RepID=UPI0014307968|nr:MBL fold metallo-hydrolase [Gottfriedia acidiceleris]
MEVSFERVVDNIYALVIWDTEWKSYNNCYFIIQDKGVTLIDSGKKIHSKYLENALIELGKTPEDVKLFLATHGHADHIEGSAIFKNAKKFIHSNDNDLVNSLDINQFSNDLEAFEVRKEFDYALVGYHTPGSVVFYHRPSKTVFTGDFLCFFGDPISKDGLVSKGNDLRNEWVKYLRDGGVSKEHLDCFLEGLKKINQFDSIVMCTGHGGVLVGNMKEFISELLDVGVQYTKSIN